MPSNLRLAFVPARCGSKSIPLKNIRNFCGRPLIYWVVEQLNESSVIDEIVVSTDCDEITKIVEDFGFKKLTVYRRQPANATDTSSTEEALIEYLTKRKLKESDYIFLVQVTSPFTRSDDFERAWNSLRSSKADSLLSGTRFTRFIWKTGGESVNYDYRSRPRRQDFNGGLLENGAFYINSVGNIIRDKNRLSGKITFYEMPQFTALELDEEDDWELGEFIMVKKGLNRFIPRNPKICLTDNDGVLTDGGIYYTDRGEAFLRFNRIDGKGFEMLQKANIKTGILTSEQTNLIKSRVSKLNVDYVRAGVTNKLDEVIKICGELKIGLEDVAYVGDDINDLEVLQNVGLAACPRNAVQEVKNIAGIVHLSKQGGHGAFREFVDLILSNS